jgi:hypothetical protein
MAPRASRARITADQSSRSSRRSATGCAASTASRPSSTFAVPMGRPCPTRCSSSGYDDTLREACLLAPQSPFTLELFCVLGLQAAVVEHRVRHGRSETVRPRRPLGTAPPLSHNQSNTASGNNIPRGKTVRDRRSRDHTLFV